MTVNRAFKVLTSPLTIGEIRSQVAKCKPDEPWVSGVIQVTLADMIDAHSDYEGGHNDLFSKRLTGSELLEGVDFHPVGADTKLGLVYVEVGGDPTTLLESNDELRDNEVAKV